MMEDIPPSYEAATARDVWDIIFSCAYFSQKDIRSICMVNRTWDRRFSKLLWEDPDFKSGCDIADIHYSFISFLCCLTFASPSVRQVTKVIRVPIPPDDETEFPLPDDWLQRLLSSLPKLTSIIAPRQPAVDPPSLSQLTQTPSIQCEKNELTQAPKYSHRYYLQLLDLSGCRNLTPDSLLNALLLFPFLSYLDLSWTPTGTFNSLVNSYRSWAKTDPRSLQVLKLRGLGLADDDVLELASTVGTRPWSLDLRDNKLTNLSVNHLLDYCFPPPLYNNTSSSHAPSPDPERWYKVDGSLWHATSTLSTYGTLAPTGPLPPLSLCHLYLAGNAIEAPAYRRLLRTSHLRVLDCGFAPEQHGTQDVFQDLWSVSDSLQALEYLRIDHQVVTNEKAPDVHTATQNRKRLSAIKTLALCSIPERSPHGKVSTALVDLIRTYAAREAALHSGTERGIPAEQQSLILEITPAITPGGVPGHAIREDRTSAAFEAKLAKDFSFFPDERSPTSPSITSSNRFGAGLFGGDDVVAEIAAFRRAARLENAKMGGKKGENECWSGRVKVLRGGTADDAEDARRGRMWRPRRRTRWG